MASVKDYIGYRFSSGVTTGEDYRKFERTCRTSLTRMCKPYGINLHKFYKNHYSFDAVLERGGKFVYVSMSDVRFWDDWYSHVLIRTMAHAEDWRGGVNEFCAWDEIGEYADKLFNE